MERFVYLIGNLLLLPFFLFFLWRRPDLRRKMLTMGIIFGPIGLLTEIWFLRDYWRPKYALGWPWIIEDFLFGFLCGSGPSVVSQILLGKTLGSKIYKRRDRYLFSFVVFGIFTMTFSTYVLGVNSIFASMFTLLISTLVIIFLRRDLLPISMTTGPLVGLIAFFVYLLALPFFPGVLSDVWLLFNQPLGKTFLGVPLTEILWAASWGLFSGPFYEFWQGYTIVPLKTGGSKK